MRVVIVGRGRVGRGLEKALRRASADLRSTSARGRTPSARTLDADLVILAVSDPAIREVATRIAPRLPPGAALVHCAGSLDERVLAEAAELGERLHIGVMHPLVSFPTPAAAPELAGTTFVLAGDPVAVRRARALCRLVDAHPLSMPLHGPAYHAAAALVANGAAALATVGTEVLERLGVGSRDATRAMGSLLRTVAYNVEHVGVPEALTGPIMRGDAAAVAAHRTALTNDEGARAAYDAMAPVILSVARAAGLDRKRARAIERAMSKRAVGSARGAD